MIFRQYSTRTRIFIWATVFWGIGGALGVVEGVWALFSAEPLIPVVYKASDEVLPNLARPLALGIWILISAGAIVFGIYLWRLQKTNTKSSYAAQPPNIEAAPPKPAAETTSQIPAGLSDLIRSVSEYGNEATYAVNAVSKIGRFHGTQRTSEAREFISKFKRQGQALSSTAAATAGDYRNIVGEYSKNITLLVFTQYTSAGKAGNAYWEIGSLTREIVNRLREDLLPN